VALTINDEVARRVMVTVFYIYPRGLSHFFAHQKKIHRMRMPENQNKAGQKHPGQKISKQCLKNKAS
jgi:hypothetical protein